MTESEQLETKRMSMATVLLGIPLLLYAILFIAGAICQHLQADMPGTGVVTPRVRIPAGNVDVLFDLTGTAADGGRLYEHQIHDAMLELIAEARDILILDMFLINHYRGEDEHPFRRDISKELADAIVAQLARHPDLWVLVITDPINHCYTRRPPRVLEPVIEAGGHVVVTNLSLLPDSNPLYTFPFRVLRPGLNRIPFLRKPLFRNPFDAESPRVSVMQLARLLRFKANHRKTLLVQDEEGRWHCLVSSANAHSASSRHSNIAVLLRNAPLGGLLASELKIARASLLHNRELYSGPDDALTCLRAIEDQLRRTPPASPPAGAPENGVAARFLTETAIGAAADDILGSATDDHHLDVLAFYLADPRFVRNLRQAAQRGVRVRLLLDPNKDAFGRTKNGVPNRIVATELHDWALGHDVDLEIRWAATHGEQAHYKMLRLHRPETPADDTLLLGSANFTRRNLRGYNLEAAVMLQNAGTHGEKCGQVFDRIWQNTDGAVYSVPFEQHAARGATAWIKKVQTALGTTTGFCTY